MKNKIFITIMFISIFIFTSCESFLEEDPKSFISPGNFPETQDDAEMMLAGAMSTLYTADVYDRSLYFLIEAGSDHTVPAASSGPNYEIGTFTMDSDNQFVVRTWEGLYTIINNANVMITSIPETNMSTENVDRYVAAAKFLRAFSYFHLVRLYGGVPLVTEPVQDFSSAAKMSRAPIEDVYALIIQDLQEAEMHLPVEWEGMGIGRPDLGSAKSLLTAVYITAAGWPLKQEGMWAKAAEKAREVMEMGKYDLKEDFGDLWLVEFRNSEEDIFSLQNMTSSTNRSQMSVQTRPRNLPDGEGGWGLWYTTEQFLHTFDDQDERKDPSFLTEFKGMTYEEFNHSQPYIEKYFDVGRENFSEFRKRGPIYIPIFRYAEILLFFAEAENEVNGPTPEAYAAINEVRRRAEMPEIPEGLDQSSFREVVRQERSYELAFEGKRRYDLVRWEMFMEVFSNYEPTQGNVAPHHKLYPIPLREIQLNPELDQNPGY